MARILMVHPGPDFSVADVFNGWHKAFKKMGHEVMVYNTNDRLMYYGNALMPVQDADKCDVCGRIETRTALEDPMDVAQHALKGLFETAYVFWPDIIFFVSAFWLNAPTLQILRTRNHKIVMLHTESPYQDDEQMTRGQFADLNLLNDPTNLTAWREMDIPAQYIRHSYDPEIHKRDYNPPPKESDFTFVGTAFASRLKFFSEMDFTGLNVTLGGNGWDTIPEEYEHLLDYLGHDKHTCVDNDETARVYRVSKTGINFYRREGEAAHKGEGWSMGPREVEMAACGLFFIRDPRGESDEVFGGDKGLGLPDVLPTFKDAGEASELIKWWVAHDELRAKWAGLAYDRIQDRTFDAAARKACTWMEEVGIL